jgi:protein-disulfide isomerase-like protein with CxxC motif
MSEPTTTTIYDAEFFLDPICPWCWVTSRWVTNVQSERQLDVRWRFISLKFVNENKNDEYTTRHRPGHDAGLRMLRVLREVSEREGNDAVGRLYTAIGTEWHVHGRREDAMADLPGFVAECLAAAGLDETYANHADDASHDSLLRIDTDEALARTGGDVGTPTITIGPNTEFPRSFFGPVMPRAPKGDDAVAVWNAVATLAYAEIAEVKRTRRGELVFD